MSTSQPHSGAHDSELPPAMPRAKRGLRVLLAAALFIALGAAFWVLRPYLLPVYIAEGPMLQQATADAVSVVWFTSRPATCELELDAPDGKRVVPAAAQERRHVARLERFPAGAALRYRIRSEGALLVEATLRTGKPRAEPFSFIVFGDSGRGTSAQFRLARDMYALKPDFVLHSGDLVYPGGERYHYAGRFFRPYEALLAEVPFWPSLGNHDANEPSYGQPFVDVFELPTNGPAGLPAERNYWFDSGPARIVVFDSNLKESELRERVAPWLRDVLSEPAPHWRFVVFHHPPYTIGSHKPDLGIQRIIVPLLEQAGVDIVFNGHDHMYQRTHAMRDGKRLEIAAGDGGRDAGATSAAGAGVVYVISGAGGARLYDLMPREQWPDYFATANNQVHSFTHVRIAGDTLELRQIGLGGVALDEWSFRKPRAEP